MLLLIIVFAFSIDTSATIYFQLITEEQKDDKELQDFLAGVRNIYLRIQPLLVAEPAVTLYCGVSVGRILPFVHKDFSKWYSTICTIYIILGLEHLLNSSRRDMSGQL